MPFNTYKDSSGTSQYFQAEGDGSSGNPARTIHGLRDGAGGEVLGRTSSTAVVTDANGSVAGWLRGVVKILAERFPASIGQKAKAAALAVTLSTDEDLLTNVGGVTETAPGSDTASSGLNGRLQRVAQRLTSLIALLPTSLGQKTKANSLPVVLPSDQSVGNSFYGYQVTGAQLGAAPATSFVVGDAVGNLVEITNVSNNKAVKVDSITLQAASVGTGTWDMTILLFRANPSSSTITNDAALVLHANDVAKVSEFIEIVNADWRTIDSKKFARRRNIGLTMPMSSGSIWLAIVADATFDGPASNLELSLGFTQD